MSNMRSDWETPKEISLISPKHIYLKEELEVNPRDLSNLFNDLISFILAYTKLDLRIYHDKEYRDFSSIPKINRIKYIAKAPNSIWIKDFSPIPLKKGSIKFKYAPNYHYQYQREVDEFGKIIQFNDNQLMNTSFLALDGGNITSDGELICISENVYVDNAHLENNEVLKILTEKFNSTNIAIIPVDKFDYIGHSDSIVRFIGPKKALIPIYGMISSNGQWVPYNGYSCDIYEEENLYNKRIKRILESRGCEVYYLPSYIVDKHQDGIFSAEGCYLNFIQISNKSIIVPDYEGAPKDIREAMIKTLEDLGIEPLLYSHPDLNKLALMGGSLNCITQKHF